MLGIWLAIKSAALNHIDSGVWVHSMPMSAAWIVRGCNDDTDKRRGYWQ